MVGAMVGDGSTILDEVSVTEARQMRQHYDNVVHGKRPFLITRYRDWGAIVMARADLARMLEQYRFTVDLLPEEKGFTLWSPELGIGESGATIKEARQALVDAVCAYEQEYWQRYDAWQHIPAKSAQWPYVLRLSLARDDQDLLAMLLESVPVTTRRRDKRAHEPAALEPGATVLPQARPQKKTGRRIGNMRRSSRWVSCRGRRSRSASSTSRSAPISGRGCGAINARCRQTEPVSVEAV